MFRKRFRKDRRFSNEEGCERVFKIYRDYIQHEDLLVNHRMTWLITIQAFLWATYGFAFQKKYEFLVRIHVEHVPKNDIVDLLYQYDKLLYLLSLVGLVTTISAAITVNSARLAVIRLRKKWKRTRYYRPPPVSHLPGLTDGGKANRFYTYIVFLMPFGLGVMWVLSLSWV
jgi:hypothetical protein